MLKQSPKPLKMLYSAKPCLFWLLNFSLRMNFPTKIFPPRDQNIRFSPQNYLCWFEDVKTRVWGRVIYIYQSKKIVFPMYVWFIVARISFILLLACRNLAITAVYVENSWRFSKNYKDEKLWVLKVTYLLFCLRLLPNGEVWIPNLVNQ